MTADGPIQVNDRLATTAEGIWAVGDCAGSPHFTHSAFIVPVQLAIPQGIPYPIRRDSIFTPRIAEALNVLFSRPLTTPASPQSPG